MEKLILIQNELKAPKNQRNNFGKYNYRSAEDILEAVKPLLEKHNCTLTLSDEIKSITVTQKQSEKESEKEVNGVIYVESTAVFSDGKNEMKVSASAGIDVFKKGMDTAQTFGSSSSYARKYALNGLFLIDDTKDSDSTNLKETQKEVLTEKEIDIIKGKITASVSEKELTSIYNSDTRIKTNKDLIACLTNRKNELNVSIN